MRAEAAASRGSPSLPAVEKRPRRSGALRYRFYSQPSLFFVLPALLLVLVALLLFLLLLLLLVATFLLLTLLVLLVVLVTLLAHVGLRLPRAECRGRDYCVQGMVNIAWQFAEEIVNAARLPPPTPCGGRSAGRQAGSSRNMMRSYPAAICP